MKRTKPQRTGEPQTCRVSLVVAADAPVAVVCEAFSQRLSRMFLWNLADDVFTAGQMLKGAATALDISNDGKYLLYHVSASSTKGNNWTCVSKPPYFTALAFFPWYDSWRMNSIR